MSDTSPVLALPYLQPAQAQKHVTHNEALQRLDLLVQMVVEGFDLTVPPALPAAGALHALGQGAQEAWAGQDGMLAAWIDGAWLFVAPQAGWRAWGRQEGALRVWTGRAWAPAAPRDNLDHLGVNTVADTSNRLAVSSPATLFTHAGSDHRMVLNKATAGDTASVLFQSGWSGRAEIGLAGTEDLAVKVSPDGAAWHDALVIDRTTGAVSALPGFAVDGQPAYHRGNILGTVAQAGGVPAGAVIERGANANGQYTRFADGTQVCWRQITTSSREETRWTYPAVFQTTGTVQIQLGINSAAIRSLAPRYTNLTTSSVDVSVFTSADLRIATAVPALAIGTWF